MTLPTYLDLIDGDDAVLEPDLAGVDPADGFLLRCISAASATVQAYLGRTFEAGDIAGLPVSILEATAKLTAVYFRDSASEFTSESLGDYSYTRASGGMPKNLAAMLDPFRLGESAPFTG